LYPNGLIRKYFKEKYINTYNNRIDTWDYQWEFTRLINSGLSIMPKKNLVKNIGFGADATHTFSNTNYFNLVEVQEMGFPLMHPPFMIKDVESEEKHFTKMFRWALKRKILSAIGIKGYSFKG